MMWVAAGTAAAAVFFALTRGVQRRLTATVRAYLVEPENPEDVPSGGRLRDLSFLPSVIAGGFAGLLLAQGDLFLTGPGRSAPALGFLGAVGGWFVWSIRRTNVAQRRSTRLRHELPIVADVIALHTLAGESVASSIAAVADQTTGVMAEELEKALEYHGSGAGLAEALVDARGITAHPDAQRLYDVLIHAHGSGGRLAGALQDLAIDYRAGIANDLTSEGGRRAITSYGPVLALMVPTALLFLLYPTLLGLRALSGAP
ncbi:MAG: type II secretion system F family protein [Actinomycetia bacterium]|nr:type II secretion system F family protein [Actinomycetes bacterium]